MSAQHTPGPWRASGWAIYGPDKRHVGLAMTSYCADTWTDDQIIEIQQQSGRSEDEATANARLIAAAPKLLQLLRERAGCFDHAGNCCAAWCERCRAGDQWESKVQTAIQQATGGAS